MCQYLSGHCFFAGYPAILEYREMRGLMFWLPWIRQNSFIIYHILISSTTSLVYLDHILQGEWNINVISKLFEVQPIILKRSFTPMERRRDDVVLCRARISHAYFTNGYLLSGEIATYVLQYSSHCKTCSSQLCEIYAHQKEIFVI